MTDKETEQLLSLYFAYINPALDIIYGPPPMPHSEEEYDELKNRYMEQFLRMNSLCETIPDDLDMTISGDIQLLLLRIMEWFQLAMERNNHLKGKAMATERYTFSDDRKYRKALGKIEKELPIIGEKVNRYKLSLQEQVDG